MTLQSGLIPNLNPPGINGLVSGLNPPIVVAALLADFDYRTQVEQLFPTTAAELAAALGDAAATASYIWDCQETSGNLVDEIASEALTPANSPLQGQVAAGLGSTMINRNAVEATGSTTKFSAGNNTTMDSVDSAVASLTVFRTRDGDGERMLYKKRGVVAGHQFKINAGGTLNARMQDSSGNIQSPISAESGHDDGAWHVAIAGYSATGDVTSVVSDLATKLSVPSPALGSMTVAEPYELLDGGIGVQIAFHAAFESAAAEALLALGATAITNFWKHASDPGVAAGKTALTKSSRASLISGEIAAGFVGHFSGGTTPATTQLPITYSAALEEGAGGLGLYCNSAVVNLVQNSRTSGSATGATTNTDNFADAADGFRAATKSLATASPDFIGKTEVVVAETVYTGSVFIKEDTVGVVGRVYAYDLTAGAEIAGSSVAYTADGTWEQRIKTTFTTPALCISVSFRLEITTDTESVLHDFWQLELGKGAGAIINTSGGSAALVASDYEAVGAADLFAKSAAGELELVAVNDDTTGEYFCDLTSTGDNDRRSLLYVVPTASVIQFNAWNATAGLEASLGDGIVRGTEDTIVCKWDALAALDDGSNTSLQIDSEPVANDTGTYTSGDSLTTVSIGQKAGGGNNLNGHAARLRIWDRERA